MNHMRYVYLFFICLSVSLNAKQEMRTHSKIGMDLLSRGVVIFEDTFAGVISSSVYSGGTWSTSSAISTAGLDSSYPYLAFDVTSGYAMAVWLSSDTTTGASLLYGSIYTPGTGWSPTPFKITNNNVSVIPDSIDLSITQLGTSNIGSATWRQFNGANVEIGVATGSIANGWGTGSTIN